MTHIVVGEPSPVEAKTNTHETTTRRKTFQFEIQDLFGESETLEVWDKFPSIHSPTTKYREETLFARVFT